MQEAVEPQTAAAAARSVADTATTGSAQAEDDCVPVAKPKAVRPGFLAKNGAVSGKNFSEHINAQKKGFKPPIQTRPSSDC